MKLNNQVAVVTGAGRNIGKAIAKLFADEGAKIAVIEMHEGRGKAVVQELENSGHEAMLVLCDVAKASDVQQMVQKVVVRFGGIDILINNAALTDRADILTSTEDGVRQSDCGESEGAVSGNETRCCANGQTGARRKNRQLRLDFWHARSHRRHCLCSGQGRRHQPDSRHGCAAFAVQDSRQLRGAKPFRFAGRL